MSQAQTSVGALVRSWREQRHLSQLDLATEAEISQKHLSFIESGRSAPLRERNALLMAAGFAPVFQDRPLDDPALVRAKATIELILKAHEPYPALTVDRHWTMISANAAVVPMLAGVDADLLKPPVNVLRVSLHPHGLAPLIVNLAQWRAHLLERLRRQWRLTRDPVIDTLLKELSAYSMSGSSQRERPLKGLDDEIAVPLRIRTLGGVLSFLSTVTVFGTPTEITLSELSLEAFYPADAGTAAAMQGMSGSV
jgi:transcriptional regulator with XRE-family HTH domain